MLLNTLLPLVTALLELMLWLAKVCAILVSPVAFSMVCFLIYYLIKGRRFKKRSIPITKEGKKILKRKSILKRLLWDFPKQFINDCFNHNPDDFDLYGIHVFCGEQGAGKDVSLCEFIRRIHAKYPACKFGANCDLRISDVTDIHEIRSIEDFIKTTSDRHGYVAYLSELNQYFNSLESKNIDIRAVSEVCMLRKQAKIILGTSQVETRVAKAVREQYTYIYKPITFMGCLTIVRKYKPQINGEGDIEKMRLLKMYFFVQDDELRNMYDTYEKIQRLAEQGYKPLSEQYQPFRISIDDK